MKKTQNSLFMMMHKGKSLILIFKNVFVYILNICEMMCIMWFMNNLKYEMQYKKCWELAKMLI